MKAIDLESAKRILDLSGGVPDLTRLGDLQLKGALALQHALANPSVGFGYLADEVGMGKTYIALSVVALMRYMKPSLRVLYICPSRNVQEKWIREYESFVRYNVKVSHSRIRTLEKTPATPYVSCGNLESLIHAASSGYYGDFFIGGGSFSFPLDNDTDDEYRDKKLRELKRLIPRWKDRDLSDVRTKDDIKNTYAAALNEILPRFDLVVIDEAHNYKRGFESSNRNRVLSQVLGFYAGDSATQLRPRVQRALLLSATPYDRDIEQLRNQLAMVGKSNLLEAVDEQDQLSIRNHLKRFMVRRLNTISVNDKHLTRNQYRYEWRKGEAAEIELDSDEKKLVSALVQKRVGDILAKDGKAVYQTGLLASFESFAQSSRSKVDRFDGDLSERQKEEAQDRKLLDNMVTAYRDAGLGIELPHPKMDVVAQRLSASIFEQGKKQIVFVRRVRSVDELKTKLDLEYNEWLINHIQQILTGYPEQKALLAKITDAYQRTRRTELDGDVGGELEVPTLTLNADEEGLPVTPPKNDTLFAWFFRGETPNEVQDLIREWPTPEGLRKNISSKGQQLILLFEHNWATTLCRLYNLDIETVVKENLTELHSLTQKYWVSSLQKDTLALFAATQTAFVEWIRKRYPSPRLDTLKDLVKPTGKGTSAFSATLEDVQAQLLSFTLFDAIEKHPNLNPLLIWRDGVVDSIRPGSPETDIHDAWQQWQIYAALMGVLLRTGHGIIDLYLCLLMEGKQNLTESSRRGWVIRFAELLNAQSKSTSFSTFHELRNLSEHLKLIVKTSIPEILIEAPSNYRRLLGQKLTPVSPVIGAHGETGDRAPQARKFRMPGYPLALVSTDVFQEGEDLHTFCDSVVHYGIPMSPVSLEQKAGRVDRVNSQAQRYLQQLDRDPLPADLIQVSYPHVKQSIEYLQVRRACHNLNEYLKSLHDFTSSAAENAGEIYVDTELLDTSEIPEPITAFLESPYDTHEPLNGASIENLIAEREQYIADLDSACRRQLEIWKSRQPDPKRFYISEPEVHTTPDDQTVVSLRSARASDEVLLSISQSNGKPYSLPLSTADLIEKMKEVSWETFHRTIAIRERGSPTGYRLVHNAELLIEGESSQLAEAVDRIVASFDERVDPSAYENSLSKDFTKRLESALSGIAQTLPGLSTKLEQSSAALTITFTFESDTDVARTHRVTVQESHGFIIFRALVTGEAFAQAESPERLIELTWERNAKTDLVEFLLDPSGALRARIVLPCTLMSPLQLVYCAHTLAAEADRLEYLLNEYDAY